MFKRKKRRLTVSLEEVKPVTEKVEAPENPYKLEHTLNTIGTQLKPVVVTTGAFILAYVLTDAVRQTSIETAKHPDRYNK